MLAFPMIRLEITANTGQKLREALKSHLVWLQPYKSLGHMVEEGQLAPSTLFLGKLGEFSLCCSFQRVINMFIPFL